MGLWKSISERPVLKHLVFIMIVSVILIWSITIVLKVYTMHGKTITVPDFTGMTIDQLDKFALDNKLQYIVVDSLYDFKKPAGTVITQDPYAGMKVKEYRTVYLTVVAKLPEQVSVPNLVDLSLRQATSMLETYGLKLGRLEYTHSEFKNAVLEQKFRGRVIKADMTVKLGSAIDLVLGDGLKGGKVTVPFLIGKSVADAHAMLRALSLNIGSETFVDVKDTAEARVYSQKPGITSRTPLNMGEAVSLWYKSYKKVDFDKYIEQLKKDSLHQ